MKYVDCSKLQILQVMQTRKENVNALTCAMVMLEVYLYKVEL